MFYKYLDQMKMKRVDFYAKNLELINNDKESNDIIKRLELDFFKNVTKFYNNLHNHSFIKI